MKKVLFCVCVLMCAAQLYALDQAEGHFFGGPGFGFGSYHVNNDYNVPFLGGNRLVTEDTSFTSFAPGIDLGVRGFYNNVPIGIVFRDRVLFVTNGKTTGTVSAMNNATQVSETYSIADSSTMILTTDFFLGVSFRHILSKRIQFYADFGPALTFMSSENSDTGDKLSYFGFGVFSALALQVNLTRKVISNEYGSVTTNVFLEFGVMGTTNIVSSQKGTIHDLRYPGDSFVYEDTGMFDLSGIEVYIGIGWRIDAKVTPVEHPQP